MTKKRDERTAIDNLNKITDATFAIYDLSSHFHALGLENVSKKLAEIGDIIYGLADEARGDISQSINQRYNDSMQEMGNILKACLNTEDR